jgi:beta-hydroxyacyl-ACP dehydratase FabZ
MKLDINQISSFLPHAFPFLLIDRILSIEVPSGVKPDTIASIGTKVTALKNVTMNEWFFQGHFPKKPLMPGVLLIEVMAQTASFSLYPHFLEKIEKMKEFQCILVNIEKTRFRSPVTPGDTLIIETEVKKKNGHFWVYDASISVEGKKVAEAQLMANLQFVGKSS